MKLDEIRPEMLVNALAVYAQIAYPDGAPAGRIPDLTAAKTPQEALAQFQNESGRDMEKKLHRYSLRLGNHRYPFMKLVLQEVLIEGQYFLTVDTHDEMEVKPSFPDYEAWKALKLFNAKLKNAIESRWEAEKLPTYATLRSLACELIPENISRGESRRVLVVDDDRNIRETIAALLAARGFLVEMAGDGEEALEKVKWTQPDLIVMDYEMPGMDGLAAIEKLKAAEPTRKIPVLLATAGQIQLDRIQIANAFLVKPFQTQVFFTFVDHLLKG